MELSELRTQIDEIDSKIVALFSERMNIAANIAEYKRQNDLPVLDSKREQEKLQALAALAPEGMEDYTKALYERIFELSREHQSRLLAEK